MAITVWNKSTIKLQQHVSAYYGGAQRTPVYPLNTVGMGGAQHNLQLELGRVGRLERLVLQLLRLRRLCDQLAL